MSARLDTTVATQIHPDGTVATLPTTVLTPIEAALLGEYETWLSRERLVRKLFCRTCGPDREVEVFVEPDTIGLTCGHRLLYAPGPIPVQHVTHPDLGEPLIHVPAVAIPDTPIAVADAYLLRRYQAFCRTYGLQEALWCLQCEDAGDPSGCTAFVQVDNMVILCRCQRRIFHGIAA